MANCAQCGGGRASGRDGLCGSCRLRAFDRRPRKYMWTDGRLAELRAAYKHGRRRELSKALELLARRWGWPVDALTEKAKRIGIAKGGSPRRRWTAEEESYVAEKAGVVSLRTIGRELRRSARAVSVRAQRLEASTRMTEGYNASDLARVFGVHSTKVQRWLDRGLFGAEERAQGRRVKETAVVKFLRRYPQEYDLRCVDQDWYKAMLFGALAWKGAQVS